jgi:hypothetical protein
MIVTRFCNIEKGKSNVIRPLAYIKNKISIIIAVDETFALREKFITVHANGDLENPKTNMAFNKAKNFDGPKFFPG